MNALQSVSSSKSSSAGKSMWELGFILESLVLDVWVFVSYPLMGFIFLSRYFMSFLDLLDVVFIQLQW